MCSRAGLEPNRAMPAPCHVSRSRRLGPVIRKVLLSVLIGLATLPAQAVEPDEVLQDAKLEARARHISERLRCLVCQNQSIDDSEAPLAKDLGVLVRERLKAGDTDQQIEDLIVARYGEFVLLKPRFAPHTLVLWFHRTPDRHFGISEAAWRSQSLSRSALPSSAVTSTSMVAMRPLRRGQLARVLAVFEFTP
jgi:cytochrome c-type biogenesis protein CcmH